MSTQKIFVLIPKQVNNPFFSVIHDGCGDEALKIGAECRFIGPDEANPHSQLKIVDDLVEAHRTYQHEVQNGDLEQGNEDDSFGQRSVTSITLATTETELAGNQQVQWIPDSLWTVYHYNGNSTVADEDAEVEFFTN